MRYFYTPQNHTTMNTLKQITKYAALAVAMAACTNPYTPADMRSTYQIKKLTDVPDSLLQSLAAQKIYFGHQSVGFDIMNGIEALKSEDSRLGLYILESADTSVCKEDCFAHSKNGENRKPYSKIEAFTNTINRMPGNLDIAFFKFCYVDFTTSTNVDSVFQAYVAAMDSLKAKYPLTHFVHFTAPLRAIQTGPKALVKTLMGKSLGHEDNAARCRFNQLVRDQYLGQEPLFDLAMLGSTRPDGNLQAYTYNGETIYALSPQYTYDGGHLNEPASRLFGEQLLVFLANL